jgi:hypothetical protein
MRLSKDRKKYPGNYLLYYFVNPGDVLSREASGGGTPEGRVEVEVDQACHREASDFLAAEVFLLHRSSSKAGQ